MKKIHVAYTPGRERTGTARSIITYMTSDSARKKYPKLNATWELQGFDSPAVAEVEFLDGKSMRLMLEDYSPREIDALVDEWRFKAHLTAMKKGNIETRTDE